jgi:hypothetical protein
MGVQKLHLVFQKPHTPFQIIFTTVQQARTVIKMFCTTVLITRTPSRMI